MCGRIIQSSAPLRYAIVDGMNVRDSRVHNYPPRWKRCARPGASGHPAQSPDRRGLAGRVALRADPVLVQRPCGRPQADQCQVRDGTGFADLSRCLPQDAASCRWVASSSGGAIKGHRAKQPYAIAMKDGNRDFPYRLAC